MTFHLARRALAGLVLLPLLGACATQPAYQRPAIEAAKAWTNAPAAPSAPAPAFAGDWWTSLGDPAVDRLVSAALQDNPTIAEAVARVDQARAVLTVQDAARTPHLGVEASVARSRDWSGPAGVTMRQTSGGVGARLSWELDLWGRARESAAAANSRLAARTADAEAARLSIVGDVADSVVALRACDLSLDIRDRDIASREAELATTRVRLTFGNIAPVVVAAASSNLASALTERAAQDEACRRLVAALAALSGLDPSEIRTVLPQDPQVRADFSGWDPRLPDPPTFAPALPAVVLLRHPTVVAAEREVAARWSEIAVARAARLPRIDLSALLSQQWVRALGSNAAYVAGSAGAGLTGPLFDAGAGAAGVKGAEAGYREAVARLDGAMRTAIRDIEDGLAAQQSAAARIETSEAALAAARFTLEANVARWRAGSIAQVELEESRRQFNRAQESAVLARADRARAWVALVRRAGGPWTPPAIETGAHAPTGELAWRQGRLAHAQ